jgi:hypothetical protein
MPHRTKSYRLYETAFSLASFQAVNCQATFIKSLRDKVLRVFCMEDSGQHALNKQQAEYRFGCFARLSRLLT